MPEDIGTVALTNIKLSTLLSSALGVVLVALIATAGVVQKSIK